MVRENLNNKVAMEEKSKTYISCGDCQRDWCIKCKETETEEQENSHESEVIFKSTVKINDYINGNY